jgi:hypothetical protein
VLCGNTEELSKFGIFLVIHMNNACLSIMMRSRATKQSKSYSYLFAIESVVRQYGGIIKKLRYFSFI